MAKVPEDELYNFYEHNETLSHQEIEKIVDFILSPRERDLFDKKFLLNRAI